ncbi:UNVERIFIED_CONTAM: Dynamin-related protein 5A [Sesamum radiatum]|uniref:Dynamin-related protein 5A n=1 Tax=Sesamum radiatum TaxID=300843 RepID=A0AAW2KJY9_SESRA
MDTSNKSASEFKKRFEAYNRLQAAAVAFGEKVPIPEIVALGGQSDGKSSLLEALLGFRFNVREVEMGTRRPLILQMVHDSTALEPRCRFQEEDSEEYGSPIVSSTAIADTIKSRTEALLRKTRTAVSSTPIIMRAEYAHCPNLTIIDTPGFVLKARKGEPESTPDEILSMVKSLASPPHRILLFLQQSSVEWCSSLWLDAIREIDPAFRRTIIVVSKFDNRLKEFSDRWEVDRYLSASGYLGENTRPFFVALPKDRSTVSNDEFRRQISQVFGCLRDHLESELQKKYKKATPAMLAILEQRCSEVTADLARMDSKIKATSDVAHLRRSAMLHAASLCNHLVANILLAHAGRGGSRGLTEAAAEIARAAARRSYNSFVEDLAKQCKQAVRHHLDSVTSPYSAVCYESEIPGSYISGINRTNQVSAGLFCLDLSEGGPVSRKEISNDQENIPPEKNEITPGKVADSREALRESQMTVPETPSPDQPCDGNYAVKKELGNCVEVGARKRQARITGNSRNMEHFRIHHGGSLLFGDGDTASRSGSTYTEICSTAAEHFARIREVLVERGVASTLNSAFLTPCREQLMIALGLELFAVTDDKFMDMFVAPGAIDVLQNEMQSLQKRQKILHSCLNDFKNVARAL